MGPHGINPVIITLGNFEIRWYSLMYIFAAILAKQLMTYLIKRKVSVLTEKQANSLVNYGILGLIIGARLFDVLVYDFKNTMADPLSVLKIWEGFRGLSFHGGVIGIAIAMFFFVRKHKLNFFQLGDNIVFASTPGLFLGRLGNFINSELYGRKTTSFLGFYFDGVSGLRHPSQLYEGIFEGLILFAILRYFLFRVKKPGYLSAIFLAGYGIFRFFIEYFREPKDFVGPLTMGQFLCVLMIPAAYLVYYLASKEKKNYPFWKKS